MKKRLFALLLAAIMLMGMLAACGTGEPVNSDPADNTTEQGDDNAAATPVGNFVVPEGGYDGSAVTIKFYNTMGSNLRTVLDLSLIHI